MSTILFAHITQLPLSYRYLAFRIKGDHSVPGYVRNVHCLCRHFRHDHRPQQEQHWRNILWNILFPWSIILAMGDGIRIMSSHELLRRQADLHGAKSNRLTFRFVRNCRYVTASSVPAFHALEQMMLLCANCKSPCLC